MRALKLAATTVLALGLHLGLGWAWTPLAALAGGYWARRGGPALGAGALLLSWGALVGYNYVVAADAMSRMAGTVAALAGNLPGIVVVALTLLVALLLGAVGGAAGSALRRLVPASTFTRNPTPRST